MRIVIIALLSLLILGCGEKPAGTSAVTAEKQQTFKWKLVTTWPKNYPGLGSAPENFAKKVEAMSGGRLQVKVFGAGQLVPAFEVFDAVSQGTAQMGHGASYYWTGKSKATGFFTSVPFGLNAQEMNGWLHYGGGLELWRELYDQFNLIPFGYIVKNPVSTSFSFSFFLLLLIITFVFSLIHFIANIINVIIVNNNNVFDKN